MGKFLIYEEWLNSVWHEMQGFNKKARENGMSFDKTWRQTRLVSVATRDSFRKNGTKTIEVASGLHQIKKGYNL